MSYAMDMARYLAELKKINIYEMRKELADFYLHNPDLKENKNHYIKRMFKDSMQLLREQMHEFMSIEDEERSLEAWDYSSTLYKNLYNKIFATEHYFQHANKQQLIDEYKKIDENLRVGYLPNSFPKQFAYFEDLFDRSYQTILADRKINFDRLF